MARALNYIIMLSIVAMSVAAASCSSNTLNNTPAPATTTSEISTTPVKTPAQEIETGTEPDAVIVSERPRKGSVVDESDDLANFRSNVSSGIAPLDVQFYDRSFDATKWTWNFGDGEFSSQKDPMHTYSAAGNYTVILIATNASGSNVKHTIINIYNNSAEVIRQCLQVLDSITSDSSVPRNIRRSVNEIMDILNNESEPLFLRAASSISILDNISDDPNLPSHTKPLILNIRRQLENIPVDE